MRSTDCPSGHDHNPTTLWTPGLKAAATRLTSAAFIAVLLSACGGDASPTLSHATNATPKPNELANAMVLTNSDVPAGWTVLSSRTMQGGELIHASCIRQPNFTSGLFQEMTFKLDSAGREAGHLVYMARTEPTRDSAGLLMSAISSGADDSCLKTSDSADASYRLGSTATVVSSYHDPRNYPAGLVGTAFGTTLSVQGSARLASYDHTYMQKGTLVVSITFIYCGCARTSPEEWAQQQTLFINLTGLRLDETQRQ
jgi:hypothetical protein